MNQDLVLTSEIITERLKSRVTIWPIIKGIPCFYMYYYYPTTCNWEADNNEWNVRNMIWNFKYDPSKTTELGHKVYLNSVLSDTVKVLTHFFGTYTNNLTLVCITASTKHINMLRYEEFSKRLCMILNMKNSYEHITITEDGTPKHLGGNGNPTLSFNSSFFKDKNVLLFDDVITSGRSITRFKNHLEGCGANVIGALTIGKTKHERAGLDPIYTL